MIKPEDYRRAAELMAVQAEIEEAMKRPFKKGDKVKFDPQLRMIEEAAMFRKVWTVSKVIKADSQSGWIVFVGGKCPCCGHNDSFDRDSDWFVYAK